MLDDDACDVIRCHAMSAIKYLGIYVCDIHWNKHCSDTDKFDFRKAKLKEGACIDSSRKSDVRAVISTKLTLLDFVRTSNLQEQACLER